MEPNNKKVQEDLNRLRRDHLETVAEKQSQSRKGRRIEIEESEGEESETEDTAAEVQPEVKEFTDSPVMASSVEQVGGASTSINGSNGPVPSPMAEDSPPVASNGSPQRDETPPLGNEQMADLTQSTPVQVENEATPHESDTERQDTSQPASIVKPPDQQSLSQEAPPTEVQVAPPPAPPPALPQSVQKLKDEGNDMFRRGQYGEAVDRYTKGIKILQKGDRVRLVLFKVELQPSC